MAKMLPRFLAFVVLIATVLHAPHVAIAEDLGRGFVKPPDSAKPACFWWWFNCLVNKEGVNLWPNRLIGDAALPPEKRLTRTNIVFDKNAALLPSGLLGPVRIMSSK